MKITSQSLIIKELLENESTIREKSLKIEGDFEGFASAREKTIRIHLENGLILSLVRSIPLFSSDEEMATQTFDLAIFNEKGVLDYSLTNGDYLKNQKVNDLLELLDTYSVKH